MVGAAEVRTNRTNPFASECIDRVKTARNTDWWLRGAQGRERIDSRQGPTRPHR
jgi:hypothetical protein